MKKLLWFFCAFAAITFVIIACQKEASSPKNIFDQKAAKEWYYGTFKKTTAWAAYSSVTNGKKLPDWKNGQYSKSDGMEIVEFPLIKEKKSVTITFRGQLAEADRKKIADATLSRIVFIRNAAGKIIVREVQYVPDMNYLSAHKFDISNNRIGSFDEDFSGTIVTRKWSGEEMARSILNNGKITARFKSKLNSDSHRTESCPAGSTEVIEWARDDEMHIYGDGLITYEYGEWYPTGMTWCVGNEDIEETGGCSDPGSVDCWCELIGGCEDEGGGGENCSQTQNSLEGTPDSEIENIISENETATTRDKKYDWVIFKQNMGLYKFVSHENGVHVKVNNEWRWQSLTHNTITRTGGVIGGTVSCTLIEAVPTLGLYYASMTISYHIEASAICNGSPFSFGNDFTSTLIRNVND
jgi:hypothetical protein